MNDIREFSGKYYFLSNFFQSSVTWQGLTYQNNEAAFQSAKTLNENARRSFTVLDPSTAKSRGRKVLLRDDWESVKYGIMYEICKAKFTQNADLKKKLLNTGDVYLEEGNTWHDNIWGNCHCDKCKDIAGQNHLGKILMKIREELKHGAD